MMRIGGLVVAAQEVVDLGLDRADLLGRHRPGLAEVEAQPVGGDQRALLRHVLAEMAAQGRMQKVSGGVRPADAVAARGVGLELDRVADRERAALQRADMDPEVAQAFLGVGDPDHGVAGADRADVADLAARFAVERGLVGDDHDRAGLGALHRLAADHQRLDHALGVGGGVAQELGRTQALAQVEPDPVDRRVRPSPSRRRARRRAGGPWRYRSPRVSTVRPCAAQGILRQVEREAKSVVEAEGDLAGERRAGRKLRGLVLEQAQAALERAPEAGLLELAAPR